MLLHASVFTNILNYQTITVKYLFNLNVKVAVSRDFLAIFFQLSNPSEPLINIFINKNVFKKKFVFAEIFTKYVTPRRLTLRRVRKLNF